MCIEAYVSLSWLRWGLGTTWRMPYQRNTGAPDRAVVLVVVVFATVAVVGVVLVALATVVLVTSAVVVIVAVVVVTAKTKRD